jgi:hypothetical protein
MAGWGLISGATAVIHFLWDEPVRAEFFRRSEATNYPYRRMATQKAWVSIQAQRRLDPQGPCQVHYLGTGIQYLLRTILNRG